MPSRAIWAGCENMKDCRSISYTLRAARFTMAFTVPCIPSTSFASQPSTMPACHAHDSVGAEHNNRSHGSVRLTKTFRVPCILSTRMATQLSTTG